jgi:hypothetical protein
LRSGYHQITVKLEDVPKTKHMKDTTKFW